MFHASCLMFRGDFRERAAQGPQTGHRWARFLGSPLCEVEASKGRTMQRDQVAIARKYLHLPGADFGHKNTRGPLRAPIFWCKARGANSGYKSRRRTLWAQILWVQKRGAYIGYKNTRRPIRVQIFWMQSTRHPLRLQKHAVSTLKTSRYEIPRTRQCYISVPKYVSN